jgi:hypothetical protein
MCSPGPSSNRTSVKVTSVLFLEVHRKGYFTLLTASYPDRVSEINFLFSPVLAQRKKRKEVQ